MFVLLLILLFFYFVPLGLWIQAVVSLGVGRITIIDLIRMRLRKIAPRLVVDGVINSHKSGLNTISTDMLETHYLAGGTVPNVVSALIAAAKANIPSNGIPLKLSNFEIDINISRIIAQGVLDCR